MQTRTDDPTRQPIIETWRIAALILLAAASMLFVHAVVPADAGVQVAPSTSPTSR